MTDQTLHLDASVVKIDDDGNSVLTNTVEPGDKLLGGLTYDDIKNGTSVKAHDVDHTDTKRGATVDETKTHTVAATEDAKVADKPKEPETITPSKTTKASAKETKDEA
jgi:hypothetical protein